MGDPVDVLDRHYLAITLLVTVGYQLLGFAIAWTFQFDKITDFTGGSNFFILALLTLLLGQEFSARNIITSVFVMVWASRLAGFLLFRVLKTGSDTRFDDIRSHFFKFLGFWIGQILWVWVVSLPLTVLNSPAVTNRGQPAFGTASDILGIIIWVIGWLIESIADIQKFQYKSSGAPKDRPIDVGLWGWSRHPPYFGEILCWWGIWTLSIAPSLHGAGSASTRSAQLGTLVSPLFTMILLLFGSGVPTAEKPAAQKFHKMSYPDGASQDPAPENAAWANYQAYRAQTSILLPLPPVVYRALPQWVKRTVLLDLPMYEWTP
ncbi:DUF1295-domain-containing protein [Trametes versicolor FP-101664 SS1]|uniref:DUF1295-domain-containing protein n=1 Tax=Trametes versicolor (strain FP-101664) TaxID=717944 RepID=UPI0004622101|nr:DUF1295-domain-containing protein [Trametes versicolor FP-101664 SS1]EIW55296.1 DUF1295-domain-containing protein [Trametes versicolor FP-101664 SS1]